MKTQAKAQKHFFIRLILITFAIFVFSGAIYISTAHGQTAPPSETWVWNQTNDTLTVTNPLSRQHQSFTLGSNEARSIPDTWEGQSDPKHPYFNITGSNGGQYCETRYGKRYPGTWIVKSQDTCEVATVQPPPPPAEPVIPIISDFPDNVILNEGQQYSVSGLVYNPEDLGSAPQVSSAQGNPNWLYMNPVTTGNQVEVTISGSSHTAGSYSFTLNATNSSGGAASHTIYITVSPHEQPAPSIVPRTIAAWIYDATSPTGEPGYYIEAINAWNSQAHPENKITELYTYGTDMEIYDNSYETYYTNTTSYSPSKANSGTNSFLGPLGTWRYKVGVTDAKYMSPIVDGRTDNGYLQTFNSIPIPDVQKYADLVALQFCSDANVNGIQVDVEPLDFVVGHDAFDPLSSPTQVAFYNRLVDNFNGQGIGICQGKQRYASVFTFAYRIHEAITHAHQGVKQETERLLSQENFLVIDSLYDLPAQGPSATMPSTYKGLVRDEIEQMLAVQNIYQFNYKFGIPASCSFHECAPGVPANNIEYVKAALEAIGEVNQENNNIICSSPHFKGIVIWAYDHHDVDFQGQTYNIRPPSSEVVEYISKQGSQVVGCHLNQ